MPVNKIIWPDKRPGEKAYWVLEFDDQMDLEDPIDTLATVTWTVPPGITRITAGKASIDPTSRKALIWLENGTAGETYEFVCTITTANGITLQRGVTLAVKAP